MSLVKVNLVCLEPLERLSRLIHYVISREAFLVGSFASTQPHLGRDNNTVTMILQEFPNNLLGPSIGVDVGGVKEIHTKIQSTLYNRVRLIDLDHPCFRML